jgi:hypothetical protein
MALLLKPWLLLSLMMVAVDPAVAMVAHCHLFPVQESFWVALFPSFQQPPCHQDSQLSFDLKPLASPFPGVLPILRGSVLSWDDLEIS